IGTGFYSSIGLEIKPEKTFSGAIELGYLTRPYQKLTNMKYVTFSPMASYNVPDASFKIGAGVNLPTQDGFDTKAIVKAGFEYRIWTFFGIEARYDFDVEEIKRSALQLGGVIHL